MWKISEAKVILLEGQNINQIQIIKDIYQSPVHGACMPVVDLVPLSFYKAGHRHRHRPTACRNAPLFHYP